MMPRHNIRADMRSEGESFRKELSEPPGEDVNEAKGRTTMAKSAKGTTSKSAGKQKLAAGGKGKMHGFSPVKPQKPGQTAQQSGGKSYSK